MCEPKDLATWNEVLMFVRYEKDRAMAYRNALIKEKAIIRDQKGINIGWTSKIDHMEGNWNDRLCFGLLRFQTPKNARRWLEGDHPVRQHDFLGQVDILIAPLQKSDMTQKGYPIIQIINQTINFRELYEQQYLPKMESAVTAHGGVALVVCRDQPWKWRGIETPGALVINQFADWFQYERFINSPIGRELKEFRNQIGNGYAIAAEVHCDM